jgi:hypothetical protein
MEHPPSFDDGRPPFDHALAAELIGKHVLVGITYVNRAGEVQNQLQFHGTVIKANYQDGIVLSLAGLRDGETYRLPPDTRAYSLAMPGEYRLRSTGEVVVDPDYTSSWTITTSDA